MSNFSIDPQATGWRDDGTEGGLIRAEIARSELVQMPFKRGNVAITTGGVASGSVSSGGYGNTDGSSTRISATVTASATLANFVVIQFWIFGNVFGLRYDAPPGPIGCMIDGVGYPVPITNALDPRTGAAVSGNLFPSGVNYSLIANDLGEGPHFVELLLPSFASGSSRSYAIHGYVVDSRAGYVAPGPYVNFNNASFSITAITAGTATAIVVPVTPTPSTGFWGYRKLLLCNTHTAPVVVTAVYSTRTSVPIWRKTIPVDDTIELDLGGLVADINNLYFYASVAGVINATPIGVL